jgi:ABC-type Mn2+/Zn2+ transport system ATPase subunit
MLGLYQPTEGAVFLDGVDLRQLDPADLRRNVGYVEQDTLVVLRQPSGQYRIAGSLCGRSGYRYCSRDRWSCRVSPIGIRKVMTW